MEYGSAKNSFKEIRTDMKKHPFLTLGILLSILLMFIGTIVVATWVSNKVTGYSTHKGIDYRDSKTIYSNFVPTEGDIIDLDHSGTLTPSPYNLPFGVTPDGSCTPTGNPLIDYSQGIVLILNITPTLSSQKGREILFRPPSSASNYFTFEAGTVHNINTNGRTFLVSLSRINNLSTTENGPYFSYVFEINEQ